jgi:heterodisulfide reductase subunit B
MLGRGINTCPRSACRVVTTSTLSSVKAITSFDLDTSLKIVNGSDNVVTLCPNCRWKLDNGLQSVDGKVFRRTLNSYTSDSNA